LPTTETLNKTAFIAKQAAFGVHLRKMRALDMELGVVQPPKPKPAKVKGQRSKKWRKSQRKM
jgi:hypothetical protein